MYYLCYFLNPNFIIPCLKINQFTFYLRNNKDMFNDIVSILNGNGTVAQKNLKVFGLWLLIVQIILLALQGFFLRLYTTLPQDDLSSQEYLVYQDINVMIVIGFAYLMTFIKNHSISALVYTFLINAIVVQFYMLLTNFWFKAVFNKFTDDPIEKYVGVAVIDLINACGCVGSVLISFGGVIGRVGPKDLLLMSIFHVFAYTLNEVLVKYKIWTYDAGGATYLHSYGAYFGLAVSWILSKKIAPIKNAGTGKTELVFSMIGTLFLWLYWPTFNFAGSAGNRYEQLVIVTNTIYSLIGSCIATFIVTSLGGRKISMEDILNATLAGGVCAGGIGNVCYYPPLALACGLFVGTISTFGFRHLTPFLQRTIGLYDTCGIHNLHAIPGMLGGLLSALVVACYNSGYNIHYTEGFPDGNVWQELHSDFLGQAGRQVAGTFCSIGFGLVWGCVCGFVMTKFYDEDSHTFFKDEYYFELAAGQQSEGESEHLMGKN